MEKENKKIGKYMHDLSIAIVTYNNEKSIKVTLESIIKNLPKEIDYILYIIDNKSIDNTLDIVKTVSGNIKVLISDENKGFASGHNKVLKQLDSKYHIVVNPDIYIENEEHFRIIIEYMDKNTDIGLLSPLLLNEDLTIQYLCKKNPTVFDMIIRRISPNLFKSKQREYIRYDTGYKEIIDLEYASGCYMFFRTKCFLEIGGFDDNFFMYLEDADITRRINKISRTIFFPFARIIHTWDRKAYKSFKYTLINVHSMLIYFRKWGWRWY